MNYYGGKELAAAFRTVRENTIKIAEDIPENKFGYRPAPETRTVAELLAHIGASTMFQSIVHGSGITDMMKINFQDLFQKFTAEETKPRTKAELLAYLEDEGNKFASFLEGASDSLLAETVSMRPMPGSPTPTKSRFEMLMSAKEHEMHHRGQLMTYQRLLGITPHLTRVMQQRAAAMQAAAQQQAQS